MPRVKGGTVTRQRRKRVLKLAKGYYGSKHTLYKTAHEQLLKSLSYAYRDRKQRKRDFRKLWITRINAACRQEGISYSKFMHGLKLANVDVNRKMLADLAINDQRAFAQLVEVAKTALANPPAKEEVVKVEEKAPVKEVKKEEPKVEEKPGVKEELTEIEQKAAEVGDLSKLTVAELRKLAKVREISIPSGSRKADIVKLLSE